MRKQAVAFGLVGALAIAVAPVSSFAQTLINGVNVPAGQGLVNGVATDAAKKVMKVTIQLKDSAGHLVSVVGTNDAGVFTITAPAGNYTIVMVDSAGNIIGSSAGITVVAGQAVSVNIAASAIAGLGAGTAGAVAGAGAGTVGGVSTAAIVAATVGGAAIATVAVVKANASPSR